MSRYPWNEWGPRFRTAVLVVAWWMAMPLALVLLTLLYPLSLVVEACEKDAEKKSG